MGSGPRKASQTRSAADGLACWQHLCSEALAEPLYALSGRRLLCRWTKRGHSGGPQSDPHSSPYPGPWSPKSTSHPLTIQLLPSPSLTPLPISLTGFTLTCKYTIFIKFPHHHRLQVTLHGGALLCPPTLFPIDFTPSGSSLPHPFCALEPVDLHGLLRKCPPPHE